MDNYSIENSGGEMSVVFTTKGNEEISWETNTNINIGADFELLRGRLGGTLEYFNRKTTDMLFYFPVAPSSGYSGYYDNVGDMRNRGFEITLHGTPIQTKNFRWDLTLNMSHYKNKVTYLAPERNRPRRRATRDMPTEATSSARTFPTTRGTSPSMRVSIRRPVCRCGTRM